MACDNQRERPKTQQCHLYAQAHEDRSFRGALPAKNRVINALRRIN